MSFSVSTYLFDVNIWGTVSDWVMILGTSITGIVIWRTLRSQNEVQKLQQTIASLELRRYLQEIMPDFEIDVSYNSSLNHCIVRLTSLRHTPNNVSYEITDKNFELKDLTKVLNVVEFDFQPGTSKNITLQLYETPKSDQIICSLDVNYYDSVQTKYLVKFNLVFPTMTEKSGPFMLTKISTDQILVV